VPAAGTGGGGIRGELFGVGVRPCSAEGDVVLDAPPEKGCTVNLGRSARGSDSLSELLSFLSADGCELLMVLSGYFDESERQAGDEPICVAGYVFRPGAYRRFAKRWSRFLHSSGLSHLHMTDLYAGKGDYLDFTVARRAGLLGRAVELINAEQMCGVAVAFKQAEFERMAPPWFAGLQGSIYSAACQACMLQAAYWLREHGCSQRVAYVFETGHKFQHEANAIMRKIATGPDVADRFGYQSHSFVDKQTAAGLQAADILAWTLSRTVVGFPRNRTMDAFKPYILALANDDARYQANFFFGRKLERYLKEQLEKPDSFYFRKPPEFRNRLR
jgi:hypothetical protein